MDQDQIYDILTEKLQAAGCLSEKEAKESGWTSAKQNAWKSFAFHKLGIMHFDVPTNVMQMLDLGLLDVDGEDTLAEVPTSTPALAPAPSPVAAPAPTEVVPPPVVETVSTAKEETKTTEKPEAKEVSFKVQQDKNATKTNTQKGSDSDKDD